MASDGFRVLGSRTPTRVRYSLLYMHVILKYIVMTALGLCNIFNVVCSFHMQTRILEPRCYVLPSFTENWAQFSPAACHLITLARTDTLTMFIHDLHTFCARIMKLKPFVLWWDDADGPKTQQRVRAYCCYNPGTSAMKSCEILHVICEYFIYSVITVCNLLVITRRELISTKTA